MAHQNFFEKHSKLVTFVLVLFIFIGTDLLFGTVYKSIFGHSWVDAPLNRAIIGEKAYRIRNKVYHHGLAPNVDLTGSWGVGLYQLATDSLGFKNDAPRNIPLESSNHRVLFIGDSFTEGVGMPYANTFAGMIAKDLANNHVEILNAAVVSYSPIIYWRKVKYLIEDVRLKFDEVVVFLDLSDLRDEFDGYYIDEKGSVRDVDPRNETKKADPSIGLLHNNSIVMLFVYQTFIRNLDDALKGFFISQSHGRLNKKNIRWSYIPEEYKAFGDEGLARMEKNMERLRILLKEHRIGLTLAVYPWPDQIVRNDLNPRYVKFWQEWCRKNSIPFLNLFPLFVNEGNTKKDHTRILSQYFIKGDAHWNKDGHRLIADRFISFYNSRKQSF